jgi:hypothetical protein
MNLSQQTDRSSPVFAATTTDSGGRFLFSDVPAGSYELLIQDASAGDGDAPSISFSTRIRITVAAGEVVRVPEISLPLQGVIHGRVLDAAGSGVPSAVVQILSATVDQSGRKNYSVVTRVVTDDQGIYRKTVRSGDYYARAVTESGPAPEMFYHPATTESSKAAVIVVSEGGDASADIQMTPLSANDRFKISGKVILPPLSIRSPFIELVLTRREGNGIADSIRGSSRADEGIGHFEFEGVRPGDYELVGNARMDGRTYRGTVLVDIRDRDRDDIELVVHPPTEVKGLLLVQGRNQDVRLSQRATSAALYESGVRVIVLITPVTNASPSDQLPAPIIDADGKSFVFSDVPEGEYRIRAVLLQNGRPAEGFYIADIRAGSRSVIDDSLRVGIDVVDAVEVVVGTETGILEGRTIGCELNRPAVLFLIPQGSQRTNTSLYRTLAIPADGNFRLQGIAPGDYKAFALPSVSGAELAPTSKSISQYEPQGLSLTIRQASTVVQVPCLLR